MDNWYYRPLLKIDLNLGWLIIAAISVNLFVDKVGSICWQGWLLQYAVTAVIGGCWQVNRCRANWKLVAAPKINVCSSGFEPKGSSFPYAIRLSSVLTLWDLFQVSSNTEFPIRHWQFGNWIKSILIFKVPKEHATFFIFLIVKTR